MKTYRWKIEGSCCPNCALKIADRMQHIEGVREAGLSVLSGLIKVKAEAIEEERLFAETEKIFREIEPDAHPVR